MTQEVPGLARRSRKRLYATGILLIAMLIAGASILIVKARRNDADIRQVDYLSKIDEYHRQRVTQDENMNTLLWQAIGPKSTVPQEYFEQHSIPMPPEQGNYFQNWAEFCSSKGIVDSTVQSELRSRLIARAWKTEDQPRAAEWLKRNESALNIVERAVMRPKYYNPTMTRGVPPEHSNVIPNAESIREFANALIIRARLHQGSGNIEATWNDLMTCYRLGRHLNRGATMWEVIVSHAIMQLSTYAQGDMLTSGVFDTQALVYLKSIEQLVPLSSLADVFDYAERNELLFLLQSEGGTSTTARQRINVDFDAIVAAAKSGNRQTLKSAVGLIQNTIETGGQGLSASTRDSAMSERQMIGQFGIHIGTYPMVINGQDRARQIEINLKLAYALAAYKNKNRAYPESLDLLSPEYLKTIGNDLFTQNPLIYRRDGDSYLLYSVGPNGKDEGGNDRYDTPRGDDISVRKIMVGLRGFVWVDFSR